MENRHGLHGVEIEISMIPKMVHIFLRSHHLPRPIILEIPPTSFREYRIYQLFTRDPYNGWW